MNPENIRDEFDRIIGFDNNPSCEVLSAELLDRISSIEVWLNSKVMEDPLGVEFGTISEEVKSELIERLQELDERHCAYLGQEVLVSGVFSRQYISDGNKILISGIDLEDSKVMSYGFTYVKTEHAGYKVARGFLTLEDDTMSTLDEDGYFVYTARPLLISHIKDPLYVQYRDRGDSEEVFVRLHTELPGIMQKVDSIFMTARSSLDITRGISSMDFTEVNNLKRNIVDDLGLYIERKIRAYFSSNSTVMDCVVADIETEKRYKDRIIGSVNGIAFIDDGDSLKIHFIFMIGSSKILKRKDLPKYMYVDPSTVTAWEDINDVLDRIAISTA